MADDAEPKGDKAPTREYFQGGPRCTAASHVTPFLFHFREPLLPHTHSSPSLPEYSLSYAPSGRASCKASKCKLPIAKGSLRFTKSAE